MSILLILILTIVLLLLLCFHLLELGRISVDKVGELLLELVRRQTLHQRINRLNLKLSHQIAHFLPENVDQVKFKEPILFLHSFIPLTESLMYFDIHGVGIPQEVEEDQVQSWRSAGDRKVDPTDSGVVFAGGFAE